MDEAKKTVRQYQTELLAKILNLKKAENELLVKVEGLRKEQDEITTQFTNPSTLPVELNLDSSDVSDEELFTIRHNGKTYLVKVENQMVERELQKLVFTEVPDIKTGK